MIPRCLLLLITGFVGLLGGAGALRAQFDPIAAELLQDAFVTQQNYPDPDGLGPQILQLNPDGSFEHLELGRLGTVFKLFSREVVFEDGVFQLSRDPVAIATKSSAAKPLPGGTLGLDGFRDQRFTNPAHYPARTSRIFRMLEGDTFRLEAVPSGLNAASAEEFERSLVLKIERRPRASLTPYALLPAPPALNLAIPPEGLSDWCPSANGQIPDLACGEYVIRLYRRPVPYSFFGYEEAAGEIEAVPLDAARVLVWPRASMTMSGMEAYLIGPNTEPQKVVDRLPPVTLNLRNLYPDSRTSVWLARHATRDYASAPLELHRIDVLDFRFGPYFNPGDSPEVVHPYEPQNRAFVFDHFDKYITTSGFWWIQVRTVSAHDEAGEENQDLGGTLLPMTVAGVTEPVEFKFEVARIRTRGQISSAE